MHSVGRNPSLIRILAGAMMASLGNAPVALRRTYNPSRTTQQTSGVSMFSSFRNNPPRNGKASTSASRSPLLVTQLQKAAAQKRARKNEKRHYDYQKCTTWDFNHANYHQPVRKFAA